MAFLSGENIEKKLNSLIKGADKNRVEAGAYELALGAEVFITGEKNKRTLQIGQQASIPPGQMAILLTEEGIKIPNNMMAFISMKSKFKMKGLINISGFHVDPGFEGHLKFSVYNAGNQIVYLQRGDPMFPIWFCKLEGKTKKLYGGKKKNQNSIDADDVGNLQGEIASPAALDARLKKIERLGTFGAWALGIILAAIVPVVITAMIQLFSANYFKVDLNVKNDEGTANSKTAQRIEKVDKALELSGTKK